MGDIVRLNVVRENTQVTIEASVMNLVRHFSEFGFACRDSICAQRTCVFGNGYWEELMMGRISLISMWILAIVSIVLVIITAYMGFVVAFFIHLMNAVVAISIIMEE